MEGYMIYYVYYNSYGYPTRAINAAELTERYGDDPDAFLKDVGKEITETAHRTARVGVLHFKNQDELSEFLASMDDANLGFFEGEGESRPYNF
jgi:hypothetical protein